jgi:hypothetical protein
MTSMQKAKGSGFERECAKILTENYGLYFNRNISGSGNFLGRSHSIRKTYLSEAMIECNKGDIVCPSEFHGRFVIECKFYKDFPFHHLLINKEIPDIKKWIEQQKETIDVNDFWVIVFKINRCGTFIIVPEYLCKDFIDDKIGSHSWYYQNNEKYLITDFEQFIKLYKDKILEKCNQ